MSHLKWYLRLNLTSCSSLHSSQVILSYSHLKIKPEQILPTISACNKTHHGYDCCLCSLSTGQMCPKLNTNTNRRLMLPKTSCPTQLPRPSNSTCFWPGRPWQIQRQENKICKETPTCLYIFVHYFLL